MGNLTVALESITCQFIVPIGGTWHTCQSKGTDTAKRSCSQGDRDAGVLWVIKCGILGGTEVLEIHPILQRKFN